MPFYEGGLTYSIFFQFTDDIYHLGNPGLGQTLASPYGFEAYYTARIVALILSRISHYPDYSDFISAIYRTPLFKLGGYLLGPVSDSCSVEALIPCCNQLTHFIRLVNTSDRGPAPIIGGSGAVSWTTCSPSLDLLLPINVGVIHDPTDDTTKNTIKGLQVAFNQLNNDPDRQGLRPLQMIDLTTPNHSDYATTAFLIESL